MIDGYIGQASGRNSPLELIERPLGGSAARTGFESAVPGLLVFAVIMLVFQAAMSVARESESGAIRRLRMTRMTSLDYLAGTSGVLVVIALVAVLFAFGTAVALGFSSVGPLWVAMLVAVVLATAVIGVGLMVAAVTRSVTKAFLLANFPFALLAFFSGSVFPVPDIALVRITGHDVGPFSLLPSTHAVTALNKIFTLGADLSDAAYELTALVVLTVAYFATGVILLNRSIRRS